jgi:exportin-T
LSTDPIDDEKRSFLASLLQVLIDKLKWDPTDDPDDLDDDDKAAFDGLRKVLLSTLLVSSGLF